MVVGPDELRVSVVRGGVRADLVVPAAVSVAELLSGLLPELVQGAGRREPTANPEEVGLSVLGGARLDPGAGLAEQGVPDGAVLTVSTAARALPPVDDDLAAVVAEVAETVPRPGAQSTRRAVLAVGAGLLGLGAGGVVASGEAAASVVGALVSLVLVAATLVAARAEGPPPVLVTTGWLAVVHAGAAAVAYGVLAAGAAVLATGLAVASPGHRRGGAHLWAAALAGSVLILAGLVAELVPVTVPVVLACLLVAVVVTGDLHPWVAALSAGLVPPPLGEQPPTAPDRDAVTRGVRRAHAVLLVGSVGTGVLLAVLGPVAVTLGVHGLATVLLCCAVVALRARRHRVGAGGALGLVGGLAPLLPVAVAAWWQWPDAQEAVVAVVASVGVVVLAACALPALRTARAGRVAELAEALALVSLPPALLAATGLLAVVREVVG